MQWYFFKINFMRLAPDTLKRTTIQEKKAHLMGITARIFDAPLASYDS